MILMNENLRKIKKSNKEIDKAFNYALDIIANKIDITLESFNYLKEFRWQLLENKRNKLYNAASNLFGIAYALKKIHIHLKKEGVLK